MDEPAELAAFSAEVRKIAFTPGRFAAEQAIQAHGGLGMIEETPATRLARRILMAEFEWGDRHWQAARLAAAA